MINGIPQKYGQEYKATNTTCNEKKRVFSTDIAAAYPSEAKVKTGSGRIHWMTGN